MCEVTPGLKVIMIDHNILDFKIIIQNTKYDIDFYIFSSVSSNEKNQYEFGKMRVFSALYI